MVITMQRAEGEAEGEGGVIEWGQAEHTTPHTRTHTQAHSTQRWPLNCTASTRKMIVPIERKIAQQAQAQELHAECGEWMQDGPSRLWAKQSHKVENYI